MKMKVLLIVLLVLVFNTNMFGQKEYVGKVNQFNNNGNKEGYWVEKHEGNTFELYYRNGLKSGIFKSYSKTGTLSSFGEYTNGEITEIWYYFGDEGHLLMMQKDFSTNKDTVILDNGKKYLYPHKCYAIFYYPSGIIEAEGGLLWNDDPEMDDAYEYGKWKYYDETGKLIKTEQFN